MARPRRYRQVAQQTIVSSAARTASGSSSAVTGWARNGAVAKLSISAVSGVTPQLTVFVEDSRDGSTWTVRDTFPAKTAVSDETRTIPSGLDVQQRVRWTISGATPSFTFSVQFAASSASLV